MVINDMIMGIRRVKVSGERVERFNALPARPATYTSVEGSTLHVTEPGRQFYSQRNF